MSEDDFGSSATSDFSSSFRNSKSGRDASSDSSFDRLVVACSSVLFRYRSYARRRVLTRYWKSQGGSCPGKFPNRDSAREKYIMILGLNYFLPSVCG